MKAWAWISEQLDDTSRPVHTVPHEAQHFERTLTAISEGINVVLLIEKVWELSRQNFADLILRVDEALALTLPFHGLISWSQASDAQKNRLARANIGVINATASTFSALAAELESAAPPVRSSNAPNTEMLGGAYSAVGTQLGAISRQRQIFQEKLRLELKNARARLKASEAP